MNKARCKHCNDIVESKDVHDFVTCKCFRESHESIRKFEQLRGSKDKEFWDYVRTMQTGFYLDGRRCGGNINHLEWIE